MLCVQLTWIHFNINIDDNKNYFILAAKHNAYENNFNYIHQRKIKIDKKNSNLLGEDKLIATDKNKKIKNTESFLNLIFKNNENIEFT